MPFTQVHVRKDDLAHAELAEVGTPDLAAGAIRLAIESFSVTANNITYAVAGEAFKYWNFFPAPGEMGIVPMWGHARVVASNHDEIAEGERVYGYLPMAEQLDVMPTRVAPGSFMDAAAHRQPMSPIYNQYTRLGADPEHDPAREAERMIFGPLFKTGFLIEYFMRREKWFDASRVILTSASSKTAMGLASVARQHSPDISRVGLTSRRNVEFVEDAGLYDEVLTYEEIGTLSIGDSVSVDFAGNAEVLGKLHEHLGETLKYSALVGATHIEERGEGGIGSASGLPGAKPTLFFAPDHATAFFKEHGPEKGGELIAQSWHVFLDAIEGTVEIERRGGIAAARETYLAMIGGEVDPAKGIVIEP